jgi:hypothetical protein
VITHVTIGTLTGKEAHAIQMLAKLIHVGTVMAALTVCAAASSSAPAAMSPARLSAPAGACASIVGQPATLVSVAFASLTTQRGILTIYNEGANPICATGDAIYYSVLRAAPPYDPGIAPVEAVNLFASSGLAYRWTRAGAEGNVFASFTLGSR